MRLYHHPFSSNARRAVLTAHHLGLIASGAVTLSVVDLAKREQRTPDYLAKNPNGRVPLLEDDGFLLWESHAIMQYLADTTPGQQLYPTDPRGRADVNRWMFWNAHHFAPSVSVLGFEHVVKKLLGLGAPDPAAVKRGEDLVRETARVLDAHLAHREWLSSDRLTLADLAVATPLMVKDGAHLPVGDCPNLLAWLGRVQALDAWKKTAL